MEKFNLEFVHVGDCVARPCPGTFKRWFVDALCRWTGHVLWRNLNSTYRPHGYSLDHYSTRCLRCYRWGYVHGDYRQ